MMHHIFSAVSSFFLSPFNWILALLIISFVFQKRSAKRFCRIAAVLIFLIFSNQWLLDWYANKWQPKPVLPDTHKVYSCGIVAGGFGSPDAEGNGYFNATADRFIQTEKLYKLGILQHILISGGNGKQNDESFREGAWAKGEMITMGIPDSVIFVEDLSNDTYDNAAFAKHILDSLSLRPPYLLITSAMHMPRASLLFKNADVNVVPFPCNYTEGRGKFNFSSIWPDAGTLAGWTSILKETAGYLFYSIFKIKK